MTDSGVTPRTSTGRWLLATDPTTFRSQAGQERLRIAILAIEAEAAQGAHAVSPDGLRALTCDEQAIIAAVIWKEVRQHPATATCGCPAVVAEAAIRAALATPAEAQPRRPEPPHEMTAERIRAMTDAELTAYVLSDEWLYPQAVQLPPAPEGLRRAVGRYVVAVTRRASGGTTDDEVQAAYEAMYDALATPAEATSPYTERDEHERQSSLGTHLFDPQCPFCFFDHFDPEARAGHALATPAEPDRPEDPEPLERCCTRPGCKCRYARLQRGSGHDHARAGCDGRTGR